MVAGEGKCKKLRSDTIKIVVEAPAGRGSRLSVPTSNPLLLDKLYPQVKVNVPPMCS